jgi:hypothetical protein
MAVKRVAVLVLLLSWASASRADEPLRIDAKGGEVRVEVADGGAAVLHIASPGGIGRATVERTGDHWPMRIVLRLHLKGLESLYVEAGDAALEVSVPSSPPHTPRAGLRRAGDNDAAPIDKDSPYFPETRVVPANGEAGGKIPLEGGYFQVSLPAKLLEGNPRAISIRWIDFFRG